MLKDGQYAVHEVFYRDDGRITGYTAGPVYPRAESPEGLAEEFERYRRALAEPVLDYDAEDWFEVWAEDRSPSPPYLLVVRPDPTGTGRFQVLDPKEGDRVVFQDQSYEVVKDWLLEDEFSLVMGRTMSPDL